MLKILHEEYVIPVNILDLQDDIDESFEEFRKDKKNKELSDKLNQLIEHYNTKRQDKFYLKV